MGPSSTKIFAEQSPNWPEHPPSSSRAALKKPYLREQGRLFSLTRKRMSEIRSGLDSLRRNRSELAYKSSLSLCCSLLLSVRRQRRESLMETANDVICTPTFNQLGEAVELQVQNTPALSRLQVQNTSALSRLQVQNTPALSRLQVQNTPAHYGTKPGHFETSKIHFPTSEGVSEVNE